MPRLTNRPPQMRRYAGDKARVSINGKYRYLGKWGTEEAKTNYNRLIREWRKNQELDATPSMDRCLVAELAADYVDHARSYYGPGHNRATSIIPVIRRFGTHWGDMWADEFRPRHLEAVRQLWIDRGCSRQYVNRVVRDIVRCFQWGVTQDKVPSDVWHALQSVPPLEIGRHGVREAPKVTHVPLEVVSATLPELSPVVRDMVRVQLLSGCRPNEVMRLTPGAIDRSEDVWRYQPLEHKNAWRAKARVIYFGPQSQTVLAPYLLRPEDTCCFLTRLGKPYARGGYRQAVRRAIRRANKGRLEVDQIPHWTPNQLRHLRATELRKSRNLEAARAILGHSSETVTLIYAELDAQPAIDIARELG